MARMVVEIQKVMNMMVMEVEVVPMVAVEVHTEVEVALTAVVEALTEVEVVLMGVEVVLRMVVVVDPLMGALLTVVARHPMVDPLTVGHLMAAVAKAHPHMEVAVAVAVAVATRKRKAVGVYGAKATTMTAILVQKARMEVPPMDLDHMEVLGLMGLMEEETLNLPIEEDTIPTAVLGPEPLSPSALSLPPLPFVGCSIPHMPLLLTLREPMPIVVVCR